MSVKDGAAAGTVTVPPDLKNFVPRNESNPHEDLAYTGFFVHHFLFHVFSMFSGIVLYAGEKYGLRPLVSVFVVYGVIYCLDQLALGFLLAYIAIRLLKCDKNGDCEPWITSFYQPGNNSYPLFRGYSTIQILFGIISSFCVYKVINHLYHARRALPLHPAQKAAYVINQPKPGMAGAAGLPVPAVTPSTPNPVTPTKPSLPTNQPSRHSR